MSLTPGHRLGSYEIVGALGAGGMGVVYRALDLRLKREVALKVLPEAVALDADRSARFQREAEVLATLTHPHIAAIHGMEEFDGRRCLVLELVEGETIADRIARGPLPLDDVLHVARQLASALDYAHERGILHRDLKPANIKLTPGGQVKLLDFGLAKALVGGPGTVPADPASSPTIASPALLTSAGLILGTAAYMAPEQARGQAVDRRADIWAFGCVVYEMLTGARAFAGDTVSDTIAAVLRSDVDWARLPVATPPRLVDLLKRCLTRDVSQRLRDIGDAGFELDPRRLAEVPAAAASSAVAPSRRRSVHPAWWLAAAAVAGAAFVASRPSPTAGEGAAAASAAPLMQLEIQPGVDPSVVGNGPSAVLSPDGTLLAMVVRPRGEVRRVFIRRLNDLGTTPLQGTEDARDPFFSPDGRWIAFFAQGRLKKVPTVGGAVITLCDAPNGRGGDWGEDGDIIFNPSSAGRVALHRVSAAGGNPVPVFTLADGEVTQRWPQILPGGRVILYSTAANLGNYTSGRVAVRALPDGVPKTLVTDAHFGRYLPSGHLVYVQRGRVFAAPMDLDRLEITGAAVPVLERVATAPTTGGAQLSFSSGGTAVYVPASNWTQPLTWVGAGGSALPLRPEPTDWSNLQFSPDGSRLAMDVWDGTQTDLWIFDVARDAASRLTFDPTEDQTPIWSPDGAHVAFRSARDLAFNLYMQRVDGTGEVRRLTTSPNPETPTAWHPSGRWLAYSQTSPATGNDIMLLPFAREGTTYTPLAPQPFLSTRASETVASFSPDGRWIAYSSDENGRNGIYVRAFPGPGGQWLVASEGTYPSWSASGRQLFFVDADQRLMVTTYQSVGDSFRYEPARPWSVVPLARRSRGQVGFIDGRGFAVHPDGRRVVAALESASDPRAVLMVNLFDELRRLVPASR